jgi:hypothetical protein
MAEFDSDSVDEQPAESREEHSPFGFGEEVSDDNSAQDSDAPNEQTNTPSIETNGPQDSDEGPMLRADYSRKTQDLAEQRRAFDTERSENQAELATMRQEMQVAREQMQQNQQIQSYQQDPLMQAANDPARTREEVLALQALANNNQQLLELQTAFAELKQAQSDFGAQSESTQATLQQFRDDRQKTQNVELRRQGDEAVSLFSEQAVRDNIEFIQRNFGSRNPRTQEPYSVAELVGMASGETARVTNEARSESRDDRGRFKKQAGTNGSQQNVDSVIHDRSDAEAEIERILG